MSHLENNYVFIHIGKTAGTSMRELLRTQFQPDEVCPAEFMQQFESLSHEEIEKYRLFMGHLGWSQAERLGERRLTFLRNPTERYLSLYYYWNWLDRSKPEHQLAPGEERREPGLDIAKAHSLEEFVELDNRHVLVDTFNTQVWQLAYDHGSARREHESISEDTLLKTACEHLEAMDFFGIVEDLGRGLKQMERVFGWSFPDRAAHRNQTPKRPTSEEIPVALRRKIRQRTELDWELYSFALRRWLKTAREQS